MARVHARVKGKSGSTRPVEKDNSFVKAKAKDVESLIVKFAKEDAKGATEIGRILRDTHGVPSVKTLTGKSIGKILEENKVSPKIPEDLKALQDKAQKLKKHMENNRNDVHNKRGLLLIESKIRRLTKYYKNAGRID